MSSITVNKQRTIYYVTVCIRSNEALWGGVINLGSGQLP